jgi:hypothetical protein
MLAEIVERLICPLVIATENFRLSLDQEDRWHFGHGRALDCSLVGEKSNEPKGWLRVKSININ